MPNVLGMFLFCLEEKSLEETYPFINLLNTASKIPPFS
jgi:hypothetical protein